MFGRRGSSSASSKRRLLIVTNIKAHDLLAVEKKGTSDPYASVALTDLGGREIKSEIFKTKGKSNTLSPVFSESFTFGQSYNLDTMGDLPSLTISLFHKSTLSVSETPLGQVTISLEDINAQGLEVTRSLPVAPTGRTTKVCGTVEVTLRFSRAPTDNRVVSELEADEEAAAKALEEHDETTGATTAMLEGDVLPNELVVNVLQGRRLLARNRNLLSGGGPSSDPLVIIEVEGFKTQKTSYKTKELNPVWNEKLVFRGLTDPGLTLIVTVEDYETLKNQFIGRIAIPVAQFIDKKVSRSWYKLKYKNIEDDGTERGELELAIHWRYNRDVAEELRKKEEKEAGKMLNRMGSFAKGFAQAVGLQDEDDMEVDIEDNEQVEELDRQKTDEEKAEEQKQQDEKKKELSDIVINEGDYQVQVHIIEARDLKAENLDGTSDPMVFVECFGQKRNTITIKNVTSCVYDELFIFNMKNLDKEAFEEGMIKISCYDSSILPFQKTMIGAYAIDATMVYTMNKDHELYRQWVPLMDDEDPEDVGVQGYLKISIAIIGPGEKVKVHDEDAERAAEIARETAAGSDVGSLLMSTPLVIKEWKFLVVRIFKCEGLPIMDGQVGLSVVALQKAGTDAVVQVSFAGGKPLRTKTVTCKGNSRKAINPQFYTELWYPVSMPTMTQIIKLAVLDEDGAIPTAKTYEVIANVSEKLTRVKKANKQTLDVQWYNLYGAPEFKNEKLLANVKKAGVMLANKAKQTFGADIDWGEFYNNAPDKAPAYKGRMLMQIQLSDKRPAALEKKSKEIKPVKCNMNPKQITAIKEPKTKLYVLQALVLCGTELPKLKSLGLMGEQYRIMVSIGINDCSSKVARLEGGVCRWNELIRTERIVLPEDLEQVPDIFVYLVRDDAKPICFKRMKATKSVVIPPDEEEEEEEESTTADPDAPKKKKPVKTELQAIGFEEAADWVLLQEDKSINALDDDVFPGSVLMKIGFGPADQAEQALPYWKSCIEKSRLLDHYQVRVHVYQAKNLPAADSNGLCDPFIVVNFMGQTDKTKTVHKSLYPVYYETIAFNNMGIPNFEGFTYAPQVCFRLYDKDNFDSDDYLGTCSFPLKKAILTEGDPDSPDAIPLPDPTWIPFFYEVPGDSQGELLVNVELVKTMTPVAKEKMRSIVPPQRSAIIEMIVIGMRDLAPYNFQSIQAPFIDVSLNSFGTTFKSETNISKKPEAANPNFLERLIMPVQLPLKSIYSTPLLIMAKDTRLGGFLKPTVGVCQIDLSTKLPWDESTYKPPATDMFFIEKEGGPAAGADGATPGTGLIPGTNADEVALKTIELQNMRKGEAEEDDFIVSQEPVKVDNLVKERVAQEDTGAGVFGALNHIKFDTNKNKTDEKFAAAFGDPDWSQDDGDQPPKWSVNRKKLDSELEMDLKTTPFENYDLTRGQVNGFLGSTVKIVGRLKGLVRVMQSKEEADANPFLPPDLMTMLLKPQKYVIRLYALRAFQLAEMDVDIFGRPSKSDPYLRVKLGKKLFDDRQNAVDDTVEVDIYQVISLETELPGISNLNIEVMDKDIIGSDDLIGRTHVDLEDRWFDKRWQDWGMENEVLPDPAAKEQYQVRFRTKPVERRTLYAPGISQSQGIFECWVDIMTQAQATAFPPDDVALPPKQLFELRVVIWKTKNVPPMDWLEGMSDLFVKCWPEGCSPQETDTHWRCKKGKASFNWRLLFDVELGHNTRAMKFPYFHLQLWDRDILKWNDCAGEGMINLGRYYRKAYKRNMAIKLFEKKKGVMAKRAKQKKDRAGGLVDNMDDIPPEELDPQLEQDNLDATDPPALSISPDTVTATSPTNKDTKHDSDDDDENDMSSNPLQAAQQRASLRGSNTGYVSPTAILPPRDPREDADSDDDEDDQVMGKKAAAGATGGRGGLIGQDDPLDSGVGALPKHLPRVEHKMLKKSPKDKKKKVKGKAKKEEAKSSGGGIMSYIFFWRKKEEKNEDKKPLLEGDAKEGEEGDEPPEKSEEEKKEDENSEMKEMVTTFKNMTGLWDIDPDDSAWYHLETRDKNEPTKVTPMGSICYSIQLWPKDKATVMAVGAARSEPNTNPFLPPPVGRLKFSWNPFVLGSELCGPALCAQLFCCLLYATFIVLMIFCQPFLNIIINLIFVVY